MSALPPLSLYLHLPWCVRKCPYCDFNSHVAGAGAPAGLKERYIDALIADLRLEAPEVHGRTIESVFLGGGTPSLFSAAEIATILDAIGAAFRLADDAEITMEANPGTLERGKMADYRRAGVNRLSLGAQSFNEGSLQRLGRIHGVDDIVRAFREAEKAAFHSINLDLMFALPGQNLGMAMDDLRQAVALGPAHLSWYQLTLEPNTVFHSRPPAALPDEDLVWDIEQQGHALLAGAGYRRYEVSAYARPGFRCRHNLNYWLFGDYLGIGAGAHGKITRPDATIWRTRKPEHPRSFMEQIESGRLETHPQQVERADAGFEYLLNALRLPAGFDEDAFVSRTGQPFSTVLAGMERGRHLGLVETNQRGQWKPTRRGTRFLNDLQALFLA